jgi:hypothetical protein
MSDARPLAMKQFQEKTVWPKASADLLEANRPKDQPRK